MHVSGEEHVNDDYKASAQLTSARNCSLISCGLSLQPLFVMVTIIGNFLASTTKGIK